MTDSIDLSANDEEFIDSDLIPDQPEPESIEPLSDNLEPDEIEAEAPKPELSRLSSLGNRLWTSLGSIVAKVPAVLSGFSGYLKKIPKVVKRFAGRLKTLAVTLMQARSKSDPRADSSAAGRKRLIAIAVAGVVIVVALALVLTFAVWLPHKQAVTDFDEAAANFRQAQASLASQVRSAEDVLTTVDADQIDDPTTAEQLSQQLASAKESVALSPPEIARKTAEINDQTTELVAHTETFGQQANQLTQSAQDVQQSQLSWAKATLIAAIDEAQKVYDKYVSYGDKKTLAALEKLLTAANQQLESIEAGDPALAGELATQAARELEKAQKSVIKEAPIRCKNGVILPKGINAMVCGGMPAKAKVLTISDPWFTMKGFQTPSGSIGCSDGYGPNVITCEIVTYPKNPPKLVNDCKRGMRDDASQCSSAGLIAIWRGKVSVFPHGDMPPIDAAKMDGIRVPVLQYGQVAKFKGVACLSAKDGVTCWNTSTHHGFRANRDSVIYW